MAALIATTSKQKTQRNMIHLSAKTIYVPIAALVLLTGSCTNANEPIATDPHAIAFQTSVQTRAVKESFGKGDAFTVWGG